MVVSRHQVHKHMLQEEAWLQSYGLCAEENYAGNAYEGGLGSDYFV